MVTIRKYISEICLLQGSFRDKRTQLNSAFVNPIKSRKILAAGKNRVMHYSINSISFSEMSTERNK